MQYKKLTWSTNTFTNAIQNANMVYSTNTYTNDNLYCLNIYNMITNTNTNTNNNLDRLNIFLIDGVQQSVFCFHFVLQEQLHLKVHQDQDQGDHHKDDQDQDESDQSDDE